MLTSKYWQVSRALYNDRGFRIEWVGEDAVDRVFAHKKAADQYARQLNREHVLQVLEGFARWLRVEGDDSTIEKVIDARADRAKVHRILFQDRYFLPPEEMLPEVRAAIPQWIKEDFERTELTIELETMVLTPEDLDLLSASFELMRESFVEELVMPIATEEEELADVAETDLDPGPQRFFAQPENQEEPGRVQTDEEDDLLEEIEAQGINFTLNDGMTTEETIAALTDVLTNENSKWRLAS